MKRVVKVDHLAIAQVLGEAGISRGDPDFREIVIFLELRYLHYHRLAQIKGLSDSSFHAKIMNVLVTDLQAYLASAFQLSADEDATIIKRMHGKYHFLAQATPEEHAAAARLIKELSEFDQQVMVLLRDGLSQPEIAEALGIRVSDVTEASKRVKAIYQQVKIN
jgi:DNA-binding NarL/FixJ family response regulator